MPKRGHIMKGHVIPYGTFNQDNWDVRQAYYNYGYRRDEDLPELPCPPPELAEEICLEDELFKKEMAQLVDEALNSLVPRYARVLRMRFGVGMNTDYTLEEVGRAFGVTQERIRQMQLKGMRSLKHPDRGLQHLARPEEYTTTMHLRLEKERLHREWEAEKHKEDRYRRAAMHMPTKKKELWDELKPALKDAAWVADLKTSKPDMYQELQDLVKHLWGDSFERVWNTFTRREHHV
jgi:hypothetical protein